MITQTPTMVIGIGSPFGADQLGWKIIEHLKQQQSLVNDKIRLESCNRPGTLLLDYFKGVEKAIIIDAIEGGAAGNLQVLNKAQLLRPKSLQSSHQLGVAEVIVLGEKLKLLPQQLVLLGVETGNTELATQLTDEDIMNITNQINHKLHTLVY